MSGDEGKDAKAALIWWGKLGDGEQAMWRDEAESSDPLDCYRLYWSRGPQLDDKQLAYLTSGRCPRCHYRGFVIGPQGGGSTNVECGNTKCRERYNVLWWSGTALMGHLMPNGETNQPWPSEPPREH